MKAEQVLAVLMDDKKYAAKVKELKDLEVKLDVVRKIAATLEDAEAILEAAKKREDAVMKRQKEIEEELKQALKQYADKAKEQALQLDARAAKEREQYRAASLLAKEGKDALCQAEEQQASYTKRMAALNKMDEEVRTKEQALLKRIQRVNEAFNG